MHNAIIAVIVRVFLCCMLKKVDLEMRFFRPMAGYTLWDRKRSTDIKE